MSRKDVRDDKARKRDDKRRINEGEGMGNKEEKKEGKEERVMYRTLRPFSSTAREGV